MRLRSLTLLTLIIMLVLPSVGFAQENNQDIRLTAMEIRLWPEFDNDDLLVILIGQLDPSVELPATITLTLPDEAELNAVAEVDANSAVLNAAYSERGSQVEIQAQTGTFQVEYYLPTITADGIERRYDFEYVADYPIDNLIWQVQQPPHTGNLVLSEQTEVVTTDQFGFPSYLVAERNIEAGQSVGISANYERSSEQLTVDFLENAAEIAHSEITLDEPTTPIVSRQSAGRWMFYLGGAGLMITLMAVVAATYLRKGSQLPAQGQIAEDSAQQFCTQCGAKIGEGSEFCAQCGARLTH